MENTKVDLKKLKEQDWEKYKKMRKVAERRKITSRYFATLILAVVIGLGIGGGLILAFISSAGNTGGLANYASNQTVAVLHNLNISFNNTNYIHWTNATLSTLISTMKTNPKALSTFAVSTYATMQSYFILSMFLITVLLVVFYILFLTNTNSIGISRTYKYFKRELNRLAERDENLRKYGFTEPEIAWYHAVRSELIKLELEYGM
jgi:predicted PurR-regulated permease PerM